MTLNPKTIYHYTDANGFLAISRSKTLWASCIECLNDEREFRHGLDLAANLSQHDEFLSLPDSKRRAERFQNLMSRMWGMYIYSCSFSAQRDLLSQWRGYCGAGNGFNMGVDLAALQQVALKKGYLMRPCIYESADQQAVLMPILRQLFNGVLDDQLIEGIDERLDNAAEKAAFQVREVAAFMKDAAFREEQEWRLITHVYNSSEHPSWHVRPSKTSLIPYVELDFADEANIFSQVTIGPGPFERQRLFHIAVSHLRKSGIQDIDVQLSKVPYRFW